MWGERRWPASDFVFQWAEEDTDARCVYAREFERWTEELGARLLEHEGLAPLDQVVAINQVKVLLLDGFQKWRDSVPKAHQSYTGERHICLFHVFDAFYKRLRLAELALQPPLLFLPDPPVPRELPRFEPPPPAELNGIFIGERIDDDVFQGSTRAPSNDVDGTTIP